MSRAVASGMQSNKRYVVFGSVLLALLTFGYSYFFTERLPWFWYDDVQRLEMAEQSSWFDLIRETFNFTSTKFQTERPVLQMFVKFCLAIFGEDPHLHRVFKLLLFCTTLVVLYRLQIRNKVHWGMAAGGLLLASSFPSVMIVTAWVNESATFELLFKACAMSLFFSLMQSEDRQITGKRLAGYALLLILVIFADHAKGTGKIIPVVFLATLAVSRSRQCSLYTVSLLALAAVIPYGLLLGNAVPGAPAGTNLLPLLHAFTKQAGVLMLCPLLVVLVARHRSLLHQRYLHLLFCWWMCEMFFYAAYPSNEMRYIYSSLFAALMFATALVSLSLAEIKMRWVKWGLGIVCTVVVLNIAWHNTRWNDSFRGSFGGYFVLIDKKIRDLNTRYDNALILYSNFTLPYYERRTTNRYVNLSPVNAWKKTFNDVYRRMGGNILYVNIERFKSVIAIDESALSQSSFPLANYDSVIEGSLWDRVHQRFGFMIWQANLYDISLTFPARYPDRGAVYFLPSPRQL